MLCGQGNELMRTRRVEMNREARRFAYSLDHKPGETTASLHRRKAHIMRRAGIHVFTYPFDYDSGRNCMLCWFGEKIAINLTIETDNGKISGQICEKCAVAISEKLESAIEKGIERRRREADRGNL
jgi:hypothetical protein